MSRLVVLPIRLRLLTLAAVLATGCIKDGEEGQSCTATKDCVAGLVCDIPSPMTGVCRKPADVPVRPDAAVDAVQNEASAPDVAGDRAAEKPAPDTAAERPPVDAADGGSDDGASDGAGDGLAPDATGDAAVDAAGG